MALKTDTEITVYLTVTREVTVTGDPVVMAEAMGVDLDTLTGIIENDDDWDPTDAVLSKMADSGDIESEEIEVSEITA